jgi:hypothetical protein
MRGENIWYSHFNFTTKAKGAGGMENLFFAEVLEGDEMTVSCFCMINTDANGILCSSLTFKSLTITGSWCLYTYCVNVSGCSMLFLYCIVLFVSHVMFPSSCPLTLSLTFTQSCVMSNDCMHMIFELLNYLLALE